MKVVLLGATGFVGSALLKEALDRGHRVTAIVRDPVPVQREVERVRSPLVSIPPLRGGDFQGIRVYRSDMVLGRARKANFRAQQHRLDEPTKLSLGMVASLQSPLPFYLARSL